MGTDSATSQTTAPRAWRSPYCFTVLTRLSPDAVGEVRKRLETEKSALAGGLANVAVLHDLRLLLVPSPEEDDDGVELLLNAIHDGPVDAFLEALVEAVGDPLGRVLEPQAGEVLAGAELTAWLCDHREGDKVFFIGLVGRSTADIAAEKRLHDVLSAETDARRKAGTVNPSTSPEQLRRDMRDFVVGLNDGLLPAGALPGVSFGGKVKMLASAVFSFANPTSGLLLPDIWKWTRSMGFFARWGLRALMPLWLLYTFIPTCLWYLLVRLLELTEPDIVAPPPSGKKLLALEDAEDEHLQNEMTMYIPVRGGMLRRFMLRWIFVGSASGVRHLWARGKLAGIDTIHYARFYQTHGGRCMLFLSNYDGSWDRYLSDFLTVGNRAVVPIWGSTRGCPKTRWFFGVTPGFGPRFFSLTRLYQTPAVVWYSAFPNLSVRNMLDNAALRDGLFAASMRHDEAQRWCDLI